MVLPSLDIGIGCVDGPRIYERRSVPKAKQNAASFLRNINPESVLQIAMMCDAAQEELDLILGKYR